MNHIERQPYKSFWIWFSPRTGSTLLCKALEETGVCGKAGEFFFEEEKSLLDQCDATNYLQLRQNIWARGMSENGVLGAKHSAYSHRFLSLSKELKHERHMLDAHDLDWDLWADIFPNCTHIFLTRRNKIRQAVSWWKAIQDEQWHLVKGSKSKKDPSFYADKYNVDALTHLLDECFLREAMTESFFEHNQITPHVVVYEDLIRNYDGVLKDICQKMDIESSKENGDKPFDKTANQINEEWADRFRTDLQKGWDRIMW